VYKAQDVRRVPLDEMALNQDHKYGSVVYIEVECDKQNCEAQVQIRTLLAFDAALNVEVPEVLSQPTYCDVPCAAGHFQTSDTKNATFVDYSFDEDWESNPDD
jgi:hypothetical protein